MLNSDRRRTVFPPSPPSTPRLRWGPKLARRALLDGAWWPRSNDPVAELPGLILALDHRRGPVTRVMLGYAGWSSRPLRLAVAGRVIRLGWFTSLPAGLLTAICVDRDRVDLLVVRPDADAAVADAAMALAADPTNTLRTPDIVPTAVSRLATRTEVEARNGWESEGGHLRILERPSTG
jgi:hypothetical protein